MVSFSVTITAQEPRINVEKEIDLKRKKTEERYQKKEFVFKVLFTSSKRFTAICCLHTNPCCQYTGACSGFV